MAKQRTKATPQSTPATTAAAPAPTDDQLVAAVAAGGTPEVAAHDAMNGLIGRHHDRVYRYLLRRGLQPADAAIAAQNVFVNVFRFAHTYRPRGEFAFVVWLMGIARHAAEDVRRQNDRQAAQGLDDGMLVEEGRGARAPAAFVLNRELADVAAEGLRTAVTPSQRLVLEVEYGLRPEADAAHVRSRSTQFTRGQERLGEYVARHLGQAEGLARLERMAEDARREAHRRIGAAGMEALSRDRLGTEDDRDTQRE